MGTHGATTRAACVPITACRVFRMSRACAAAEIEPLAHDEPVRSEPVASLTSAAPWTSSASSSWGSAVGEGAFTAFDASTGAIDTSGCRSRMIRYRSATFIAPVQGEAPSSCGVDADTSRCRSPPRRDAEP